MASGDDNATQSWVMKEEYELLVQAVRDYALFLLGPDGAIRSWNSGATRIMGYEADEVLGRHFSLFYTEEDLRGDKPGRELEVAAEEGRVEDEGLRVRKDGRRFWANTIITALRGEDGRLDGFAKVTRDLTERRMAEERLRTREEMFRLLISSVTDYAIFMLDPGGSVMSWNEGAERIKGYKAEEVFGEHFSIFFPKEEIEAGRPAKILEAAREKGRVENEGWRLRKDGTRFWAHVVMTAIYDSEGNLRGFTRITRDITEKKKAEEWRQGLLEQREARLRADQEKRLAEASSRAAQEANRAKDEFLMMLSHELRTPLTSILGWARLLPTLQPDDDAFREGIRSIGRSAELQASLVDDVLDISRIVAGKLRLDIRRVDLASTLTGAIEHVSAGAAAKSIRVETSIPEDLGHGEVDGLRLEQIVWNLLSNAVKFTPQGGIARLSARRHGDLLEISVEDDGEGIDPEFLPYLFDAFRQADMGVKRSYGGMGLGLTIVRHLVEAHGGSISVESEGKGKGALFNVSLPVKSVPMEGAGGSPETSVPRLDGMLEGFHILIVDDDADHRHLLASVLKKAGADVSTADSVSTALMVCANSSPDLIVTDIGMRELDGYDLLERIRQAETDRNTPIVAISAFDSPRRANDGQDFDAFLRKPIDPSDFVSRLEAILH